jgi:hypothetical protein
MYKDFNKASVAGAMEFRDHLKNGASPKSLMSRGNKIILAVIGFLLGIGAIPALAQDIDPTKEVQTQYMRPSVTNVYIDTRGNLTGKVIEALNRQKTLSKFNDHSISGNEFYIPDTLNNAILKALLEEKVTKYVVEKWFPYDKEQKAHSTEVIEQRGVFNATDADVIASKASARKDALLKDVGEQLLDFSYIIVYTPSDIEQTVNKTETYVQKGYKGNCKVSVWKLDWSEEVENNFYNQWTQENAIHSVAFPVEHIIDLSMPISITDDPLKPASGDEDLLNIFATAILAEADLRITKKVSDFQVKAPITEVKINAVYAKIGAKESVTVDKRYFASEIVLEDAGQSLKRKGVVRATSKIAKNDTIATGEGPSTKFYQTYGKFLKESMLLTEKPDYGIGISLMGGLSANARVELGIGMYASSLVKKLRIPYGVKAYGQISYPFKKLQGVTFEQDNGEYKEQTFLVYSAGLSKDFYFAHILALTPYVGYSALLVPDKYSITFEDICTENNKSSGGIEAGVNFTVAILDNFQGIVNAGYNMVTGTWYKSPIQANIGLRFQF